jgi:hypothetical protein
MKANVTSDKASLARAKIRRVIECRKCHIQRDSGARLGPTCQHEERINRHDEIIDLILQKITEKEAVRMREPTLHSPEGMVLKPNLVVKNQGGVFVVDVTVRHEDGDYLQMGRSKIKKYSQLLPDLQERFGSEKGRSFR